MTRYDAFVIGFLKRWSCRAMRPAASGDDLNQPRGAMKLHLSNRDLDPRSII